ncbi:hypothetical protein GCK32_010859, partial [Trichostrongylus colubriformis]
MLYILVLLLLALTLDCRRITEFENYAIKQYCGMNRLYKKASFKIFGGRGVVPGEYPWLVLITIPKLKGGRIGHKACTGSLISPRHVLTAAHCVTDYDAQKSGPCYGREQVVKAPMEKLQDLKVYVGTVCRHQKDCGTRQRVRKVIVHENWKRCVQSSVFPNNQVEVHDLAIIELENDISYKRASPICLPSENLRIQRVLHGAGSGRDEAEPVVGGQRRPMPLSLILR